MNRHQLDEAAAAASSRSVGAVRRDRARGAPVDDQAAYLAWLESRVAAVALRRLAKVGKPPLGLPVAPLPVAAVTVGKRENESFMAARTRLAAAQADWQALRNEEKSAKLISRERHERLLRESWLPVIERLNDLPTRYGSRFGPDLAANMALLAEISRELKALAKGGNHD